MSYRLTNPPGVTLSDQAIVLLLAVGVLVAIAWSYIRNYLSKCPRCKGKGVLTSTFFPHRYRPCPRCNRKGEVPHSFAPKK